MKMRPGYTSRFIREPRIIHVRTADLIPSGMHATEYRTADLIPTGMHAWPWKRRKKHKRPMVSQLVERAAPSASVYDPMTDRTLTPAEPAGENSAWKWSPMSQSWARVGVAIRVPMAQPRGLERGLGDAADVLASITTDAKSVQDAHKRMIATMARWEADTPGWVTNNGELRRTFTDQLTNLYRDFVARSLETLGVSRPDQIDRSDPAGAIVIAIRDDVVQTIDLLEARKAQQMLARHISDLTKSSGFNIPNVDIRLPDVPWYVWAGATGVGLLALKAMLR